MPQRVWSAKRERQYEHIEAGSEQAGRPKQMAKEQLEKSVSR